ncbi:DNA methyltransferase [Candidatus Amarolinea aalborgensis]|uniref:DNA methyltransferase n=1 Tax=Candidatus Amarolinea aalborgensis TaxID=2249329 RepID=UPI003BF9C852
MSDLQQVLEVSLQRAEQSLYKSFLDNPSVAEQIEYVCRCLRNRAGTRLLMACMLAKMDRPDIDPRKPYTEIGTPDSFSGRSYDEGYISHFINLHRLPCNSTTAFLTPAFRNINRPLTTDMIIIGRPRRLYVETLQLLEDVHNQQVTADDLLTEIIRLLLIMRNEKEDRMQALLRGLGQSEDALPLSSEQIILLIEQHLNCKNSSRLPVLIIVAAYQAAGVKFGERVLPLHRHTAADEQTGALGDIEVCLTNDDRIVTAYEMKMKRVTLDDVDRALHKIALAESKLHNYIFVTTETIDEHVRNYANEAYARTGGIEIAILNCSGFLRHFLHLFHRVRLNFLNAYQELVLIEPDSAVSQPLKEAFLALRQAAEADT